MRTQFSKIALLAAFGLAMAFTFSCSSGNDDPPPNGGGNNGDPSISGGSPSEYTGGSCDASDYGRAEIDGKVWMAKNWGCYAQGSKCYNNNPAYCNAYGRLYDWATAMNLPSKCNNTSSFYDNDCLIEYPHQGICPSGWHIPGGDEWFSLVNYVESDRGCSHCAAKYLKATSGWNEGPIQIQGESSNGEDTFRFAALPGGGVYSDGYFDQAGYYGFWWATEELLADNAYILSITYREVATLRQNSKDFGFSVRCVKD
ncbi:MAG: hypothetical protein LBC64_04250 [Fibromonadaceae bacterium]|jgi:uncharacterized protein (TIGR02145 family)|nr:hypothetical protein [Fibromonadaceae bacterium]